MAERSASETIPGTSPIDRVGRRGNVRRIEGLFYVGAIVGTGAVVASGGALLPVLAAAAAGGLGGGGLGALLSTRLHKGVAEKVSDEVDRGGLILWVGTLEGENEDLALRIMRDCGAYDVHANEREHGEIEPA